MDERTIGRLHRIDDIASAGDHKRLSEALGLCVRLPDTSPTADLRNWAERELNGYGESELPSYRRISPPMFATTNRVRNYPVSLQALPEYMQEHLSECLVGMGTAELEALPRKSESTRIGPAGMPEFVQLLNNEGFVEWPHTLVELFWLVDSSVFKGVLTSIFVELGHRVDELSFTPATTSEPASATPAVAPTNNTYITGNNATVTHGENAHITTSHATKSKTSPSSVERWTLGARWASVLVSVIGIVVAAVVAIKYG